MESELVELCSICIENEATYFTECGHKYCVCCLSRIKKCAMCRKSLLRSTLCVEIKRKTKPIQQTNNSNRLSFRELIWAVNPETDINTYSFAIQNPEDFQPSGTDDGWSRIDTAILSIFTQL
jgi:hypothetical protein